MSEGLETQTSVAILQRGTGSGLLEFLDYLADKNYMQKASAAALRTGVKKVLEVEDQQDSLDMRDADLDDIVLRFRNRYRGHLAEKSVLVYEQRFRKATEMYLRWLRADADWLKVRRAPSSTGGNSGTTARSTVVQRQKSPIAAAIVDPVETAMPVQAGATMITYPFPIRKGVQGRITLPEDLTEREAARIARFIETLVSETENEQDSE